MFQMRMTDPTGANRNGVWVSPERDIAHCFPFVVRKALGAMEADLKDPEKEQRMGEYAKALATFIKGASDITGISKQEELFKSSGLSEFTDEEHKLFGKWLSRSMLGLYFTAVRNAIHPGETPLGVKELLSLNG